MIHRSPSVLVALLGAMVAAGCGGDGGGNPDDGDGGVVDAVDGDAPGDGDGGIDAASGNPDAPVAPGCVPGPDSPQCNNCVDDDGDGMIDGFDVECTGALDDDEASFATSIPGDNMDPIHQDCFFDGDSGAGNDGCNIHVCCLLGAPDRASCPFGAQQYDPAECDTPQTQQCIDVCGALVPPGCDCFGCCTICDPVTNQCFDIITNPATAPNCDATTIADPNACPRCTKVESCGTPCDPEQCILCPGQTPDDLPTSCTGQQCPTGRQVCGPGVACPQDQFCLGGCCVDGIP